MGSQNISYVGTNDTGEPTSSSIAPINNTMPFDAAHLSAPDENLRLRTEIIRKEVEDGKYLHDADREMVLFSTGTINWSGTLGTNATFTTSANLILRPLLSPYICTPATVLFGVPGYNQVVISTQTANYTNLSAVTKSPPRAYGRWGDATYLGANKITATVTAQTSGSATVTFGGTWNNEFTISFVDGITSAQDVVTLLNGTAVFVDLGLVAALGAGVTGTNKLTGSSGAHPAVIAQTFMAGAADAEQHFVTPGGFVSFFNSNPTLNTGDVIAIKYDSLVSASGGGRRQSIDQIPENATISTPSGNGAKCDSNLFLLRANSGYLPYALPLCRVMEVTGNLHFIDGTEVLNGTPRILGGSSSSLISYTGGVNWADGTTNPASNVQAQLSKIVADLTTTVMTTGTTLNGWGKISAAVTSTFADGWSTAGTRIDSVVNNIITALAGTATGTVSGTTDGAARIGSSAITGNTHTNPTSGSVKSQLLALAAAIDALKDLLTTAAGAANVSGSLINTSGSYATINPGTLQAMLATLAQVVDTEVTARASADTTLTTNLSNEATIRGNADILIVNNLHATNGDTLVGTLGNYTGLTTGGTSTISTGTVNSALHGLADGLNTEITTRTTLSHSTGITQVSFVTPAFNDSATHICTINGSGASGIYASYYIMGSQVLRGISCFVDGATAVATNAAYPIIVHNLSGVPAALVDQTGGTGASIAVGSHSGSATYNISIANELIRIYAQGGSAGSSASTNTSGGQMIITLYFSFA